MPEQAANKTTFFRCTTDKQKRDVLLQNDYASPAGSVCWLLGGGPCLNQADMKLLQESPAPKMSVNLAGTGLIRPDFWTSYDPTQRFMRSVYLDAGIMKFVSRRRSMDIVPETTYKVCECPGLYFFESDNQRGFNDFLAADHRKVVDWNDSMVQAIDILYQLGFRTIYLLGCEMRVSPSSEMIDYARKRNVEYQPEKLLGDFVRECEAKGMSKADLSELQWPGQYHFEQRKPLDAAVSTDYHYFRVAQFLRLSRSAMSLAGMRLVSVSPESRLNDYLEVMSQQEASQQILEHVGDPRLEQTDGRYTDDQNRSPEQCGMMRDFQPLHWSQPAVANKKDNQNIAKPAVANDDPNQQRAQEYFVDEADLPVNPAPVKNELNQELERMKKSPVEIEEIG